MLLLQQQQRYLGGRVRCAGRIPAHINPWPLFEGGATILTIVSAKQVARQKQSKCAPPEK
jgi:hypothetical protein